MRTNRSSHNLLRKSTTATKAGKIQLSDIRQGRTFWQVRFTFSLDEESELGAVPRILGLDRLIVSGRPEKLKLGNTRHYILKLNAFGYLPSYGRAFHSLNLGTMLSRYTDTIPARRGDPESFIFVTKNAANKFIRDFKLALPSKATIAWLEHRKYMMSPESWNQ
jgi:hypothetical protein